MQTDGVQRAAVLSGGGARGAYEAGVLAYIFRELPANLRGPGALNIVSGTSVGAINACFVAANAHHADCNIERLLHAWRCLELEKLLKLGAMDLLRMPGELRAMFRSPSPSHGIILDVPLLQKIITQNIDWQQMADNLAGGCVDAVTVSTTHIASGKTVIFVDRPRGGVPPWSRDSHRLARGVRLGPEHALASAAIPIMFPAVPIDGGYYCDGGLRQNTPLSPALRLGAERVLVIAVGQPRPGGVPPAGGELHEPYPGPALLFGKVLNALLLDHLDYDLAQLEGFNRLIADGKKTFGESFLAQMSGTSQRMRGASYRSVDTVVIRPSEDLGTMAARFIDSGVVKLSGSAGWILRRMASEGEDHHSDLLSYLAFDGRLAQELIALGMRDADAQRAQLIAFFS